MNERKTEKNCLDTHTHIDRQRPPRRTGHTVNWKTFDIETVRRNLSGNRIGGARATARALTLEMPHRMHEF